MIIPIPRPTRRISAALLLFLLAPASAFGWGEGHDTHLLQVMEFLPPAILSFFLSGKSREALVHESHYPDNFTKFTVEEVGEDALALLSKHKLPHRYSLHSETGKAVNFILLARSIARKDASRAGTWFAALSHTLADEAACNHDPLIEPILFAYKPYKIALGAGCPLDLAELPKNPDGKLAWEAALRALPAEDLPASAEESLLSVYVQPMEANLFLTRRGGRIARSYNTNATAEDRRSAVTALAECGAEGVRTAVRFTRAAWQYAGEAASMEWGEALAKKGEERAARIVRERALADDSIYDGVLAGLPGDAPVAVLLEPSVAMDRGAFGFNAKTILSAILRELQVAKIPDRALDLRDQASLDALAPANTRLLIVCAGSGSTPPSVKQAASRYLAAGGKILWVGGKDPGCLGKLSKALKAGDPALLPISQKYGEKNEKAVESVALSFSSAWSASFPAAPMKLAHNPNTSAGWHVPRCGLVLDATDADLLPLASVGNGAASACVAAAAKNERGAVQALFLPIYLLAPFAWTSDETMADFSRPTLDSMGKSVLRAALGTLQIR